MKSLKEYLSESLVIEKKFDAKNIIELVSTCFESPHSNQYRTFEDDDCAGVLDVNGKQAAVIVRNGDDKVYINTFLVDDKKVQEVAELLKTKFGIKEYYDYDGDWNLPDEKRYGDKPVKI